MVEATVSNHLPRVIAIDSKVLANVVDQPHIKHTPMSNFIVGTNSQIYVQHDEVVVGAWRITF